MARSRRSVVVGILAAPVMAWGVLAMATPVAAAAFSATTGAAHATAAPATTAGADPAELQTANGTLGRHEERKFPYGMVVGLGALTVIAVGVTQRYREPLRQAAATDEEDVGLGGLLHPSAAVRTMIETRNRPRLSWHQEVVTCLIATWLLGGLWMDAWAHQNQTTLDSVLTPWHGLFYGSFGTLTAWILWHLRYHHDRGHISLAAIPEGYGGALIGIAIFTVGAIGDQIWHYSFGIERDLQAFLSPTHLLLVIGMLFIVSSPFRSAWSDPRLSSRPSFMAVLPGFWSLTLTAMLVLIIYEYIAVFPSDLITISHDGFVNNFPGNTTAGLLQVFVARFDVQAVAGLHLTNFILIIPLLLALRRWLLPFGCATLLFTSIAAAVEVPYQYNNGWTVLGAAAAGLVCDLMIRWLRPALPRVWAFRAFATLAPCALWAGYFISLAIFYRVGWAIELSSGVVVLAALSTLGISYAMVPTPLPDLVPAAAADAAALAVVQASPRRPQAGLSGAPALGVADGP